MGLMCSNGTLCEIYCRLFNDLNTLTPTCCTHTHFNTQSLSYINGLTIWATSDPYCFCICISSVVYNGFSLFAVFTLKPLIFYIFTSFGDFFHLNIKIWVNCRGLPVSSSLMMSSRRFVPPVVAITFTPPMCLLTWIHIWLTCRASSLVGTMTKAGENTNKQKKKIDTWQSVHTFIKPQGVCLTLD